MFTEKNLEYIRKLLKKHRQSHLLAFWNQSNSIEKSHLISQIQKLNFHKIDSWVSSYILNPTAPSKETTLAPAPYYTAKPVGQQQEQKYSRAIELGRQLIASGKVAPFVVAGGQGTRLGFDGPKGDFPISPVKNKTLFQIFAETIAAVSKRYQLCCPWYIMTSPLNHEDTTQILHSNNYYGLDEKDIFIFQQGTMPNFGFDGRILLSDKATIACSPDGHGGSIKALYESSAIDDMKNRGIEFISYFQIDNPLVNIFDPLFIGLHALDRAQMSSKAVIKTDPKERVGIFCLVGGKIAVVEYSDLPDELAEKRNPDDSLAYRLGSIAIHLISVNFVEKLNTGGFSLPLHRAVKKIPHIDSWANNIEPAEPNGIKLETFVFDALPLASKSVILETPRSKEFAPVKNAAGADSPDIARQMMIERSAKWLESAGIAVPKKQDDSPDCIIEIAPDFALEKNDIKAKLEQIPEIKPGDEIYLS